MGSASFAQTDVPQDPQETIDLAADEDDGTLDDGILVEGELEEERRAYAEQFLTTVGIGWGNRQAARWVDKVCPAVVGFEGEIADSIRDRVRAIAESSGVPLADENCTTNLNIIFVADGPEFVGSIKRKSWRYFKQIPRRKRDFVLTSEAAVRWWYSTEVRGSGGKPLISSQPLSLRSECPDSCVGVFQLPSNANTDFNQQFGNSRIRSSVQRHIRAATVVVDLPRSRGIAIEPLADYIALVSLSEIWPDDDHDLDKSILSLFDNPIDLQEPLPKLTPTDEAFLCSLYRTPLNRSGERQKGRMTELLTNAATACDVVEGRDDIDDIDDIDDR